MPSSARTAVCVRGTNAPCSCCGSHETGPYFSARDLFNGRSTYYQLLRCRGCSFVWLEHPPAPEEMAQHYGTAYHETITTGGEQAAARRWAPHLRLLRKHKQEGAILDVGCSSGSFLSTLDARKWKLFGIELDPQVAKRAEALTGARVFTGDILNAEYVPGSFDVITSLHSLEHVYELRQVMTKFFEWLQPGGILYVAVPNIESWEARAFGKYWYGLELPRHLSHFSKGGLQSLALGSGFETLSITTPASSFIEASLAYLRGAVSERFGRTPVPLAMAKAEPALPLRMIRKAFRLTLLEALRQGSALAGRSAEIHAIFRKPETVNGSR